MSSVLCLKPVSPGPPEGVRRVNLIPNRKKPPRMERLRGVFREASNRADEMSNSISRSLDASL